MQLKLSLLKLRRFCQGEIWSRWSIFRKKLKDITLRDIFEPVEECYEILFRIDESPNIDCPVGYSINNVLKDRFMLLKVNMLKEMENMPILDMYDDMENILLENR